ncbi:MAG: hypothetical protein IID13_04605 [Candidatus Marinimicrobia bacterium]|nr:hypothetical protein [Candidatus Neomarinimicrobiota bacterium]
MSDLYQLVKFWHIMSFVFMSIPLFNLIVVNERAQMGAKFVYATDRYFENIIRRGAVRCFVFQASVFVSGVLLLVVGPSGIAALLTNGILLTKTVLLVVLTGVLTYVHLVLQPKIEALMSTIDGDSAVPDDFGAQLKPYRVRRKQLATFCLFLVITIIILGLQVYGRFSNVLTMTLISLAGLFAWRVNRSLIKFGWV